jgi:hypothetical protein
MHQPRNEPVPDAGVDVPFGPPPEAYLYRCWACGAEWMVGVCRCLGAQDATGKPSCTSIKSPPAGRFVQRFRDKIPDYFCLGTYIREEGVRRALVASVAHLPRLNTHNQCRGMWVDARNKWVYTSSPFLTAVASAPSPLRLVLEGGLAWLYAPRTLGGAVTLAAGTRCRAVPGRGGHRCCSGRSLGWC